jgi:hypothetical protein
VTYPSGRQALWVVPDGAAEGQEFTLKDPGANKDPRKEKVKEAAAAAAAGVGALGLQKETALSKVEKKKQEQEKKRVRAYGKWRAAAKKKAQRMAAKQARRWHSL